MASQQHERQPTHLDADMLAVIAEGLAVADPAARLAAGGLRRWAPIATSGTP